MPITIDITQDLRYRQGEERGIDKGIKKGREKGREEGRVEEKENTAFLMLKEGFGIAATHKVTGLEMQLLEKFIHESSKKIPLPPNRISTFVCQ